MKTKYLLLSAITLLSTTLLVGCKSISKPDSSSVTSVEKTPKSIVCTIYPQYDFVTQILGDNPAGIEVSYLLDNGIDLHNYQVTADDILTIQNSDLFIYVGGESDETLSSLIEDERSNTNAVALIDMVEAKEEETCEGMEEEHDDDHEDEDGHDDAHEDELDEHVWLSLKNASAIVSALSEDICALDVENAGYYHENAENYIAQINALEKEYEITLADTKNKTIVVADRYPFRYLTDDYNIDYYAAFAGCSSSSEASFETIIFLADKVDELGLSMVLELEGNSSKIASMVLSNVSGDVTLGQLNSMQSVSKQDIADGISYIGVMKSNLDVLKEALN